MSLDFSERIALEMASIAGNGERIAKLEERMNDVEEGIKNFRAFHTDVRKFIDRSDTRAEYRAEKEAAEKEAADKKDAKRAQIHFWWLGLLSAAIITFFSYVLNWTHEFEKHHHVSETPITQPTHAKEE